MILFCNWFMGQSYLHYSPSPSSPLSELTEMISVIVTKSKNLSRMSVKCVCLLSEILRWREHCVRLSTVCAVMYVTDSTSHGIRVYATNSVVWVCGKNMERFMLCLCSYQIWIFCFRYVTRIMMALWMIVRYISSRWIFSLLQLFGCSVTSCNPRVYTSVCSMLASNSTSWNWKSPNPITLICCAFVVQQIETSSNFYWHFTWTMTCMLVLQHCGFYARRMIMMKICTLCFKKVHKFKSSKVFIMQCYAEHGYARVSRLPVHLSVCPSHRGIFFAQFWILPKEFHGRIP